MVVELVMLPSRHIGCLKRNKTNKQQQQQRNSARHGNPLFNLLIREARKTPKYCRLFSALSHV